MVRITAFQIAENISLKRFKANYKGELLNSTNFELFFKYKNGYVNILNYGVVVFADLEEFDRSYLIEKLKESSEHWLRDFYREDFTIELDPKLQAPIFSYNSMAVPDINADIIKITMLQVGQSTALDFYLERSQKIYNETSKFTDQLEKHGKIKEPRKKLLRFIGHTLNIKHRIIDNLYVFDTPASTWENELLGKVNDGLSNLFDISIRFREIEYVLKNIESNLSIFIELVNANKSHRLEWIIIALILFEVVYALVENLL